MNNTLLFSEQSMIDIVAKGQTKFCTSYDALIPNCYTSHDNEADLFGIRKSGLCDEFEIKISRGDFLNDRKKIINYRMSEMFIREAGKIKPTEDRLWAEKHDHLSHQQRKKLVAPWQKFKYEALTDGDMPCNYFWYILAEGIAELDEIPEFAGVFFILSNGDLVRKRSPRKLHKKKLDFETRFNLTRKLGYRFWEYRHGTRK